MLKKSNGYSQSVIKNTFVRLPHYLVLESQIESTLYLVWLDPDMKNEKGNQREKKKP